MSYSQNKEEEYIVDYFESRPIGKFIDIGGFHPFKFSNTRKLYEMGWSGVIVEPSPKCFQSFIKEYETEPRITLLNMAVSDRNESITLFESNGDAVSTTDFAHKEKWETSGMIKYSKISVEAISMERFLNEYGHNTDFISIDTEATNFKLFSLLPDWFLKEIQMICIEHDNKEQKIKDKLDRFGFVEIYSNAENIILVR